jgi:hypothetical protein
VAGRLQHDGQLQVGAGDKGDQTVVAPLRSAADPGVRHVLHQFAEGLESNVHKRAMVAGGVFSIGFSPSVWPWSVSVERLQ